MVLAVDELRENFVGPTIDLPAVAGELFDHVAAARVHVNVVSLEEFNPILDRAFALDGALHANKALRDHVIDRLGTAGISCDWPVQRTGDAWTVEMVRPPRWYVPGISAGKQRGRIDDRAMLCVSLMINEQAFAVGVGDDAAVADCAKPAAETRQLIVRSTNS